MAGRSTLRGPRLARRHVLGGLALAGLAGLPACKRERQQLSLAIWRDYLGETTLEDFRRASGITVDVTHYASNAELYALLAKGNSGFDLVVPSSMWVERMTRDQLLAPIDHARLPNLANLEQPFANLPYDPGNRHSVPYTWLAMGIGYRRSKLPSPPRSWKELLGGAAPAARIALPADPALLFRLAAKALGFSANLFNPHRLTQAEQLLSGIIPKIHTLDGGDGQDLLLNGEVDLAAVWNGDLVQVALEDPDIGFLLPREGALLSCDCLCIPAGAERPINAHALIDFLLSAEGGAGVAGRVWFPTPNRAARAMLPPDYGSNPILFPPDRPAGISEFIGDNPALDTQFATAMKRIAPNPGTAPDMSS
ncbi:MAG: spermidine/putrescine ABC transporter substrate-binding protein [Sphingomonadales bacterium]|nr:spermidine/putrescine ABC transporter substrate-binding protein [Sphingomonadales bacterium]